LEGKNSYGIGKKSFPVSLFFFFNWFSNKWEKTILLLFKECFKKPSPRSTKPGRFFKLKKVFQHFKRFKKKKNIGRLLNPVWVNADPIRNIPFSSPLFFNYSFIDNYFFAVSTWYVSWHTWKHLGWNNEPILSGKWHLKALTFGKCLFPQYFTRI